MNKLIEIFIAVLIFSFASVCLVSLSYLVIGGFLYGNYIAKTLSLGVIWGIAALGIKYLPYKMTRYAKALIVSVLLAISIFSYIYPLVDDQM
ncbi:hypothetical protein [Paenibacillus arenosi]|uniref:Uncharacterized protein n=1 Tax=Paenibacillus arenosi TaxID=2774142 RepID=A0ABR9AWS9_9BACL|nr:hypothetical protein [Paenibacillus arenosi]MBD8498594.1 hypothetical protein [Paenibacillus arenosi]